MTTPTVPERVCRACSKPAPIPKGLVCNDCRAARARQRRADDKIARLHALETARLDANMALVEYTIPLNDATTARSAVIGQLHEAKQRIRDAAQAQDVAAVIDETAVLIGLADRLEAAANRLLQLDRAIAPLLDKYNAADQAFKAEERRQARL